MHITVMIIPLKIDLELSDSNYKVNQNVRATLHFFKTESMGYWSDLNSIQFNSTPDIKFEDKSSIQNTVTVSFTPQSEGTNTISATLYGYTISKTLEVSKSP